MSQTFERVKALIQHGDVVISLHGQEEMEADDIEARVVISGVEGAAVVEDYPDYWKGPAVLVRQLDTMNEPIHVVWGIEYDKDGPAMLVTVYRPDPRRWSEDFLRRQR